MHPFAFVDVFPVAEGKDQRRQLLFEWKTAARRGWNEEDSWRMEANFTVGKNEHRNLESSLKERMSECIRVRKRRKQNKRGGEGGVIMVPLTAMCTQTNQKVHKREQWWKRKKIYAYIFSYIYLNFVCIYNILCMYILWVNVCLCIYIWFEHFIPFNLPSGFVPEIREENVLRLRLATLRRTSLMLWRLFHLEIESNRIFIQP